jgi:hypothetical protein
MTTQRSKFLAASVLAATIVLGAGAASAATGTGSGANGIPAQSVIHFAKGATSATVSGHVAAGEDDRYLFDAKAGQTATFHLTRSTSGQTWTLVGPSGPAVHDEHSPRQSDFSYRLPETGRYYIDVTTTRSGSYRMNLSIPAARSYAAQSNATRPGTAPTDNTATSTGGGLHGNKPVVAEATLIDFTPGSDSATVTAKVSPTERVAYTFSATKGQRAHIALTGSASAAYTVIAPNGIVLHTAKTQQQRDVILTLPATGNYRVDVRDDVQSSTNAVALTITGR